MPLSLLQKSFEHRARAFFAAHPEIRHQWRESASRLVGTRLDVICAPGASNEVFASLSVGQLTVGPTRGEHTDFEDFGRGLSDDAIAEEAFRHFLDVLTHAGHLALRPNER